MSYKRSVLSSYIPLAMNFNIKMDDKKIKVDIENTNIKDILQYCKPKEQLVLCKKFGLLT